MTGKQNIQERDTNLLEISRGDQYRTVNELFERSEPSGIYQSLLIISTLIVSAGLLLNNGSIVIGGMLVTPVLTPILAVALSLAVGNLKIMLRPLKLALTSFIMVIGIAVALSLMLGVPTNTEAFIFEDTIRSTVLYFIVALASGIAATLAWVRKEIADILPGIAIAVSLVPPLALVGIWSIAFEFEHARFFLLIFIFNLLGIVFGSLLVFVLLKFNRVEGQVDEIEEKLEEKDLEKKLAEEIEKEIEQ